MNATTLHYRQPSPLSALALVIALAAELIALGRVAIVAARYVPEPTAALYGKTSVSVAE